MVIKVFVVMLILVIFSFILGFTFSRRLGAKEGIDYCFEQMNKKLSSLKITFCEVTHQKFLRLLASSLQVTSKLLKA